jgi:hypothetical protein
MVWVAEFLMGFQVLPKRPKFLPHNLKKAKKLDEPKQIFNFV